MANTLDLHEPRQRIDQKATVLAAEDNARTKQYGVVAIAQAQALLPGITRDTIDRRALRIAGNDVGRIADQQHVAFDHALGRPPRKADPAFTAYQRDQLEPMLFR